VAHLPIVSSASPGFVDSTIASDEVPQIYRLILELVGELERIGARGEATRARQQAITIYSRGWNESSRRRLGRIADDLQRRVARTSHRGRWTQG
jgi:hypothetical protein